MNVYVVHDGRYYTDENGRIWTRCNADYRFWVRYLSVFEKVTIVARAKNINSSELSNEFRRVDGSERISIYPVYYFVGASGYLRNFLSVFKSLKSLISGLKDDSVFIVRAPLSFFMPRLLFKRKYGVEVVGDAFDSLYNKTLFSFFAAKIYEQYQRVLVKNAFSVSYVTKFALQRRFPSSSRAFTTNYSSVYLDDDDYFPRHDTELRSQLSYCSQKNEWKVIAVGSLEFVYKGADVLIGAVKELVSKGYNIKLTWLGGGKLLSKYRSIVNESGLSEYVEFVGAVSPDEVKLYLRSSDLFVLPSKTEGLPRAMLEAMAISLVCVGTDVGGVGELISKDFMAKPNSARSLGSAIEKVINLQIDELVFEAQKNYERAKTYHQQILTKRRVEFYRELVR